LHVARYTIVQTGNLFFWNVTTALLPRPSRQERDGRWSRSSEKSISRHC
jgi:hypothetical protein